MASEDMGIALIAVDDFIRRMPFINGERDNNSDGVADATTNWVGLMRLVPAYGGIQVALTFN